MGKQKLQYSYNFQRIHILIRTVCKQKQTSFFHGKFQWCLQATKQDFNFCGNCSQKVKFTVSGHILKISFSDRFQPVLVTNLCYSSMTGCSKVVIFLSHLIQWQRVNCIAAFQLREKHCRHLSKLCWTENTGVARLN